MLANARFAKLASLNPAQGWTMSELLVTFAITFGLFLLALLGFLISWFVKGEKFKGGTCGRRPTEKKDDACGTDVTCVLCNPQGEKKKGPTRKNS